MRVILVNTGGNNIKSIYGKMLEEYDPIYFKCFSLESSGAVIDLKDDKELLKLQKLLKEDLIILYEDFEEELKMREADFAIEIYDDYRE